MPVYRDMTFCDSPCDNSGCERFVSEEVSEGAKAHDLPLALHNFSNDCPRFFMHYEKFMAKDDPE